MVVAVVDEGFEPNHPEISANYVSHTLTNTDFIEIHDDRNLANEVATGQGCIFYVLFVVFFMFYFLGYFLSDNYFFISPPHHTKFSRKEMTNPLPS